MTGPESVQIRVQRLAHGRDLALPTYATSGSAGLDLRAAIAEPLEIRPGEVVLCPTGLAIEMPEGFEAQVRARSGLALRYGVTLVNGPGTIDADYRGEIGVILSTVKREPVWIERGDRIAQLVFARVAQAQWLEVQELGQSDRGDGGFGHTGA